MRWRPVAGFEGTYVVSDHGDVHSVTRLVPHYQAASGFMRRRGRPMKASIVHGYPQVMLQRDGVIRQAKVHTLVLEAFRGPRPAGLVARHLDGDRTNNHWRNLEWGTCQENSDDMHRHGTVLRGEQSGAAKLTATKVRQIRRLLAKGIQQKDIATRFEISNQQVSNIKLGIAWAHLED